MKNRIFNNVRGIYWQKKHEKSKCPREIPEIKESNDEQA